MGAMENVGAVTLNEKYIFKEDNPPIHELINFKIVELHELSHMWLGNLVSIKWWDDLWLKESLATFMCFHALSIKGLSDTLQVGENFIIFKHWGIKMDQLPTTHPISFQIDNTEIALSSFDGITFSKGANVIQQLFDMIGEDKFKKVLKEYFNKYAKKNASKAEFQECLKNEIQNGQKFKELMPMETWFQQWINTPGMNIIEPKIKIIEGKIVDLRIFQTKTKNSDNCLRYHKIDIAFIYNDFSEAQFKDIIVKDEETPITQISIDKPPFIILLNCTDKSFCKVRFDSSSLSNVKNNIHLIKNKFTELICLRTLFEYVRDHFMGAPEYIKIAERIIENETKDIFLIQFALYTSSICISRYINFERKVQMSEEFFEKMIEKMKIVKNETISTMIGHNLIHFMNSNKHKLMVLHYLLSNNNSTFPINKADRQALASKLVSDPLISFKDKDIIMNRVFHGTLEVEEKMRKLTCLCAMADPKQKEEHFRSFENVDNKESDYELMAKMKGFWNEEKLNDQGPYVKQFFTLIKKVFENKELPYSVRCFETLVPPIYSETILREFRNFKEKVPKGQFTLLKLINEHLNELERAIKAQYLSELYFIKIE